MEYRGTEAWTCRLWFLIALFAACMLTGYSMYYKHEMQRYYAKERISNFLCCHENFVTGQTNMIHKEQKLMAVVLIERMIRTGDFSYAEVVKFREYMDTIIED